MKYTGTDNLEIMSFAINYNQFLVRLIKNFADPNSRVLDFGAGIGTFALKLRDLGFSQMECIEPDLDQCNILKDLNFAAYQSIADLPDRNLNFIYSLNVLEHIQDDGAAFRDLVELLDSNGILLIYVPAFNVLFSSMDKKVGHYRRYSKSQLVSMARDLNVKILKSKYVDSIGFFAALFYKYFGNSKGDLSVKEMKFYDSFIFPVSRIFDAFFSRYIGKNVFIVIQKN